MAPNPKITAHLVENQFICKNEAGAEVALGAPGPKASEALLMAIAGCSGGTMRAMMAKDGWNISKLEISVEGIIAEDRPRRYTDVHVHYTIECKGLPQEKAAEYVQATGETCFVMQSVCAKKHLTFTLVS